MQTDLRTRNGKEKTRFFMNKHFSKFHSILNIICEFISGKYVNMDGFPTHGVILRFVTGISAFLSKMGVIFVKKTDWYEVIDN